MAPLKPKTAHFVLACPKTFDPGSRIEAVLNLLPDLRQVYAPQGRLTIVIENPDEDESGTSQAG